MDNEKLTSVGDGTSAVNYYICANCRKWVSNDSVHYCTDRTQEIIDLLKQILERLDGKGVIDGRS